MRRTSAIAVLLGLSLSGTRRANADVIPPSVTCAPWEDTEVHHGGTTCMPRLCRTDTQCGTGHCYNRAPACVVSEPAPTGHRMRERAVGPCEAAHMCVVGRCVTVGVCHG